MRHAPRRGIEGNHERPFDDEFQIEVVGNVGTAMTGSASSGNVLESPLQSRHGSPRGDLAPTFVAFEKNIEEVLRGLFGKLVQSARR